MVDNLLEGASCGKLYANGHSASCLASVREHSAAMLRAVPYNSSRPPPDGLLLYDYQNVGIAFEKGDAIYILLFRIHSEMVDGGDVVVSVFEIDGLANAWKRGEPNLG